MSQLNEHALLHFLDLAASGGRAGCSGGEGRAHRLARAVVKDVPGLDQEAADGLCEFVRVCLAAPSKAAGLLAAKRKGGGA